jgi:hypothetical protein
LICEDFIEELFGNDWDEKDLPSLLIILKEWELNAKRYCVIRDFALELKLGYDPRERKDFHLIDDVVDARIYDITET